MLLHMAFHVTGKRHVFCFACTGDTEVYVYDSTAGHWRYLIELIGASNKLERPSPAQCLSLVSAQPSHFAGSLCSKAARAALIGILTSSNLRCKRWHTHDSVGCILQGQQIICSGSMPVKFQVRQHQPGQHAGLARQHSQLNAAAAVCIDI